MRHSHPMHNLFLPYLVRVVALTALLFSNASSAMTGSDSSPITSFPYSGPPAEELAKLIARTLQFPVDVDAMSSLESLTGKGRTLWYRYSLKSLPETETARKELRTTLADGLELRACESQNFVKLLEDGYTLVISYSFSSAKFEVEHVLFPRHCKK